MDGKSMVNNGPAQDGRGATTYAKNPRRTTLAVVLVLTGATTLLLASACAGTGGQPDLHPANAATPNTTASTTTASNITASNIPGAATPGAIASAPTPRSSFDPNGFVSAVDNPYFPLLPGTRFHYEGTSNGAAESVVVEVTRQTKTISGVVAVVVHDTVLRDGQLAEDTYDWYAQDRDGNVWYLGEDSKEFEDGKVVGTAGSWLTGVDGAQAGIIMPAHPQVGQTYQQEYSKGVAEDAAEVLGIDDSTTVRYGSFDRVVKTRDFTALEPDVEEQKFYAPGVGQVLSTHVKGDPGRLELVSVDHP